MTTTYADIRRAITPGTVLEVHGALTPAHTRTVRRTTSRGYYFRAAYPAAADTRNGYTAWGRARDVTVNGPGDWTVSYRRAAVSYRVQP